MCGTGDSQQWKLDVNDRYQRAVGTVISLSTAALVSPIVFLKDVVSANEHKSIISVLGCLVYWGWSLLAASIIAGVLYYYCSAKWVKLACGQTADIFWVPVNAEWAERFLDWTYFTLMVGFLGGTACMLKFMATFVRSS